MEPDPDSRARTHLANERTFLAWFRTGITLVALGLAAAALLTGDLVGPATPVRALSAVAIVLGAFMAAVGAQRYRDGRRRIDAADFRPAGWSIAIAAAAIVITAVVALGFVWLMPQR